MDTKNTLLTLIQHSRSNCDASLCELLALIQDAVIQSKEDDIDWYITNDISESDVLLLIVMNDIDLSINFHELVLFKAVQYIFDCAVLQYS
ncbi:hypothetical protein Q5H80_17805 [Vibrio sp. SNU_ST1]|uniref:hypothetical protein n=1 Tax=Vibrio sp. SNU_ST1 TaxID=3064001 RepID=UPI00272CDD31|nr:hypothetical protein [Vibrio sp. SNU_ST1]WKY60671.1 hypothetical protein Q5H80_17805 [Vibrio sp. SNU_ST1]